MSLQRGLKAEEVAKNYLIKNGLKWIGSNYRSRFGEIDLIMTEKTSLVFVEVRYRRSLDFGLAYETISAKKKRKLRLTALQYIAHNKLYQNTPLRFDVIGLQGEPMLIEWIKNAF
ncbi:MAG: YraN family protein [Legionellales bacterium RIFCSPHIGHO2_12_FULL_37_14]|nr:MAG: YraN family protein [Legionellales bacterium RIFCSPHIGHO2_12_FULL_37_14]